jgi:hypothetical protein
MFEHVTILLSFVFALALTHLLTSSAELIWARDRVRFYGLHALWMFAAVLSTANNWVALNALHHTVRQWNVPEVAFQFVAAIAQYYICALVSMRVPETGVVDMKAFFEKQRPAIFSANLALTFIILFQNFWDGVVVSHDSFSEQLLPDSINIAFIFVSLIAGWARPLWLQRSALVMTLGLQFYFLATVADYT